MANRVLHAAALQSDFELNGLPLAPPGRRARAFAIDVAPLIIPSVIAACFAAGRRDPNRRLVHDRQSNTVVVMNDVAAEPAAQT